jgi:hypothetical protein
MGVFSQENCRAAVEGPSPFEREMLVALEHFCLKGQSIAF